MRRNPVLDTDCYKLVHWQQRPLIVDSESYLEFRVGGKYKHLLFVGLQPMLEYFQTKITKEMIEEAVEESIQTLGYDGINHTAWERAIELGYMPLEICAVPEGTILEEGNVVMTFRSTDPLFAPTVNGLETVLMHLWYPVSVATRSWSMRMRLKLLFEQHGTIERLAFAINDFGSRGVPNRDASGAAGLSHVFAGNIGSDNLMANRYAKDYYDAGRSVIISAWATEHSVALVFGPGRGEYDYLNWQLDICPPDAPISVVIDTYDDINFLTNVVADKIIKTKIINRPGATIFRPDSRDPFFIVPKALDILDGIFGSQINDSGKKVLNHGVGVIQGDGMDENTVVELYNVVVKLGWSPDVLLTGSGGGLLQKINRDTQRAAIKPWYAKLANGEERDLYKAPNGDMTKASKKGKHILHESVGAGGQPRFSSLPLKGHESHINSLRPVFRDGEILVRQTFDEVVATRIKYENHYYRSTN